MSDTAEKEATAAVPTVANVPTKTAAAYQAEFDSLVANVDVAAREWGIRPDSREGQFVSAFLGSARWLGQVALEAQARVQESLKVQRDAAQLDLARVQDLVKATNATFGQARSALINLQVEREKLIERLTQETMPKVADGIQKAVLVRVKHESELLRFRRMVLSGLATLVVFFCGVGFQSWSHRDDNAPWTSCLAHQQPGQGVNQGHFFCDVTRFHEAGR